MQDARRRALLVAAATKWLAVAASLAAPLATMGGLRIVLFVITVVGVGLRVDDRRPALTLAGTVVMGAAAATAAGTTGGPSSYAYAAVVVIAADAAVQRGGGIGGIIGAGGAFATVATMASRDFPIEWASPADVYTLLLTLLVGLAFGTIHRDLPITGVVAMRATTQALDELVSLTQRVQPGLDRWAVADAVLTGLRDQAAVAGDRSSTAGPHLLVEVNGVLHGVGAPWHRRPVSLVDDIPRQRRGRTFRAVSRSSLPDAVAENLEGQRWLVHRFDDSTGGGAVLVHAGTHPTVLDRVGNTIATATIGFANAARFEDLRAAATDAARTRLAHDLHDGIAQALTHARFELDLLAMNQDIEAEELRRARNATDAALTEVRRTIGELREDLTLSAALEHHVDLVRSFSRVPIHYTVEGDVEPPQVVGQQVFRLAQEGLSNALRHSRCSMIDIQLHLDRDGLLLAVEDDGTGIAADAEAGVGLDAMDERARAVGGELTVTPRPGGGTVVELDLHPDMADALVAEGVADGDVPVRRRTNVWPISRGLAWLGSRGRKDTRDE